ncbi:MAG: DUF3850 domain-containing protein [Bacilli bacterium]|nr:DUF3850 domain-containing protein [Bacilli bacterium]
MHEMKLQSEFYYYIKNGSKRIEIRLNDEKRKIIKVNDIIEFRNIENNEKIKTKVLELKKYNSFIELLDDNDISLLADKSYNKEKLLKELNNFYSKEEQNKYGIIAIKIDLI